MATRRLQRLSMTTLLVLLALPVWAAVESSTPAALNAETLDPVDPTQAVDAPPIDPADDPWLSEEGPPVPIPDEIFEEQVRALWVNASPTPAARAAALRRVRLELGLGDLLPPALVLMRGASEEEPEINMQLARDLAPEVPAVQMSTARALLQAGDTGAAIHALAAAGMASLMHVEIRMWMIENLSLVLVIVVLGSSLAFMLLAAIMVFPHAAHDVGDLLSGHTPAFARTAALAAILLIPVMLGEGVVGLALGLFAIGFAYGRNGQRSALAMAAVLLVVGLHPAAQLASVATNLIERDPTIGSFFAVANGFENSADVERLEGADQSDLAAAHALAYRARRHGLVEDARRRLDDIALSHPSDPVMLVNRGNIEMRRGQVEEAIGYYTRSAAQADSAIVLFDLSQAYAAAFRMDEVDAALARAQALDDAKVSALSSLEDSKLVADLGLPFSSIQKRLVTLAFSKALPTTVAEKLAPGHLGARWFITASAFAIVALLCLLLADRFDHSSTCNRCGHRICTRCEETVWSDDLCEDCHHLFQNPEDTDPSLRMARLQSLSKREVRINRLWTAASVLVPGVAGFGSKRPDLAMFGLLLFSWTVTWLVWPSGILEDPMLLGSAAWVFFAIPGVIALFAYFGVVLVSLAARRNL